MTDVKTKQSFMLNCRMTTNPYTFKFYGRGKVFSKIQVVEVAMASPFISITSNNNMLHYIVGNYNGASNTNTDASQFDTDHTIIEKVAYVPIGTFTKRELGSVMFDFFSATVVDEMDVPAESNMRVTLNDDSNWPQFNSTLPYFECAHDFTNDPPTTNLGYYLNTTLLNEQKATHDAHVAAGGASYNYDPANQAGYAYDGNNHNVANETGTGKFMIVWKPGSLWKNPIYNFPHGTERFISFVDSTYHEKHWAEGKFDSNPGYTNFTSGYWQPMILSSLMVPHGQRITYDLIGPSRIITQGISTKRFTPPGFSYQNTQVRYSIMNTSAACCFWIPSRESTQAKELIHGKKSIWSLLGFNQHQTKHQISRSGYQRANNLAQHYLPENVWDDTKQGLRIYDINQNSVTFMSQFNNPNSDTLNTQNKDGVWWDGPIYFTKNKTQETTNFTIERTSRDFNYQINGLEALHGPPAYLNAGRMPSNAIEKKEEGKSVLTRGTGRSVYLFIGNTGTVGTTAFENGIETANAKITWDGLGILQSTILETTPVQGRVRINGSIEIAIRDEHGDLIDLNGEEVEVKLKLFNNGTQD